MHLQSTINAVIYSILGHKFFMALESKFYTQKSKYAWTCKIYNWFYCTVCGEKQCCQIHSCTKSYIGKLSVLCYMSRFTEAYLHHLGLSHLHHVSPWSWGTLHAPLWLPGENWKRAFTCHFSFIKISFLFHSQTKYWQVLPSTPLDLLASLHCLPRRQ